MSIALNAQIAREPSGFLSALKRGLHAMQEARMRAALQQMSDTQLAAIGIARADIDAHAAALMKP